MAGTMQLEFAQAMTDFKTMFPEMDDDVIEAVLRANQGAVDATVDQLLAMSTDYQNERLRQEMERGESPAAPCAPHAAADAPSPAAAAAADPCAAARARWRPRLLGPLPAHFLRIPPAGAGAGAGGAGAGAAGATGGEEVDDERVAALLQDEQFVAELRWDRDFMAALDSEARDEEGDFKDRLRNMGKLSRKKFAQLSRMFSRSGSRKSSGGKPAPRAGSLLLQEEPSDDDDRPNKAKA